MESFECTIENEIYYQCGGSTPIHIQNSYKGRNKEIQSFIPKSLTSFIQNNTQNLKTSPQANKIFISNELINTSDFYIYNLSDISEFELDNSVN